MLLQRVFVDANVMFSRTTRDWLFLLRLETDGMFQLHTTRDVIAETEYRLRRAYPLLPGGVITHLHDKIEAVMDDILDDFDATVPYAGLDPDDRHVHAGAVASRAQVLLTNDRGFEDSDEHPYEVYNTDDWFVLIDDSAGWLVERVVHKQRAYSASRPAGDRKSLVVALRDADCPEFAVRVERHLRSLSGVKPRPPRR